ncbi:MAG TPA: hypothetical protein VF332_02960 [Vicinamibacterales bacterium]
MRGLSHVASHPPAQAASWWGLCAALSTHYMHQGRVYPVAALAEVDVVDARLVPLLESPERMLEADWMALLSYSTLLRVRRVALLYDGYPPHPARHGYWVGLSVDA